MSTRGTGTRRRKRSKPDWQAPPFVACSECVGGWVMVGHMAARCWCWKAWKQKLAEAKAGWGAQ